MTTLLNFFYSFILFVPLLNSIFLIFAGSNLGLINSYYWSSFWTFFVFFFLLSVFLVDLFSFTSKGIYSELNYGSWTISGTLDIDWNFSFDSLSTPMLLVVLSISFLVQLYSADYMEKDPHSVRFLAYLSLFTFFMLILVTAGNFFVLFLGWEGVGLCSYLLINFWYTRIEANKAAIKALLMNRIGDFFIILSMCLIFKFCKTLDFSTLFLLIGYFSQVEIKIFGFFSVLLVDSICFTMFLGIMGKSAQIGLHTWLPDAMEGPTPVSALIHAATMVTAGVYLSIRCSFLFQFSDFVLNFMIVVGLLTSLMAGLIGCSQWDIKKIIAYSTCSQLGFMIFVAGFGNFTFSFYHLITHAYFKALLFLSAGSIIHFFSGEQDIRKMGSFLFYSPYVYLVTLFANLSLIGFPYTSGFYSKDFILQSVLTENSNLFGFTLISKIDIILYLILVSVFLTSFYSFRLMYYVFWAEFSGYKSLLKVSSNTIDLKVVIVFFILFVGSLITGFFLKDIFLPSSLFFKDTICLPSVSSVEFIEFIPFWIKSLPFIISIFSLFSVFLFINSFSTSYEALESSKFSFMFKNSTYLENFKIVFMSNFWLNHFLNQKFYFDVVYNYIGLKVIYLADNLYYKLDKGILEYLGPLGVDWVLTRLHTLIDAWHNGSFYDYTVSMFFFFILYFLIIFTFVGTPLTL